ncbi:MAG TPA: glutathione synthase [Deltaproteobacteria bacterium]|nr:MAG: glutathione synthase [Pseudomonadota bacterium]HBM54177.1 glutathione synthase [Deltaproteobacteria bacterium]|tara:strand:+ start:8743 stop:10086 length:1344 start_codon:yes stop_codon:yes gene_type:complete
MTPEELRNIIDRAHYFGLLQKNLDGQLVHAPFSLTPYQLPSSLISQLQIHTQWSSLLFWKVAQNSDFLREILEPTAKVDEFVRFLLSLIPQEKRQDQQLLINRNDFLFERKENGELQPLQVEFNTISASFAHLSGRVTALHQQLQQENILKAAPLPHDAIAGFASGIKETIENLGWRDSALLILVQPKERNWFDQMGLFAALSQRGVKVVRATLAEVHQKGKLKNGDLWVGPQRIGVVYFRAGYAPGDLPDEESRSARRMLEASTAVLVPEASMQLAGTKKIQQVLADYSILSEFVPESVADQLKAYFAMMFGLEEEVEGRPAREFLAENAEQYVLKPQREGGGNNVYGAEIKDFLTSLPTSEDRAWIAMKRIEAETAESLLVVQEQAQSRQSISELGIFGLLRAQSGDLRMNMPVGHLVRTKASNVNEGGVVAGYACLNSLTSTNQ